MPEGFKAYLEQLEALSTEELDRSAMELVLSEKQTTAQVIAHIAEISRRKGDLERGYSNLFDYCVRRLGLSEGSVALRIQVANVARRFPQVLQALAAGRIRLSVAGRLAPHLGDDTVEKLLGDCAGMTKREVEEYLVSLSPKPVLEPSIRKRPSRPAEDARAQAAGKDEMASLTGEKSPPTSPIPPSRLEPARPEVYNFCFAGGKSFKEKLLRLAEVLGVENPGRNLAEVLERALDLALERKDPRKQNERRQQRERRRLESTGDPRPGEIPAVSPASVPSATPASPPLASGPKKVDESRHIPHAVRGRVLERAGYQCEFTGPDGVRCPSRTGLEIEHRRPFAIFRSHDERGLEASCPAHNRFRAECTYGTDFIQKKIEERRIRPGVPYPRARVCSQGPRVSGRELTHRDTIPAPGFAPVLARSASVGDRSVYVSETEVRGPTSESGSTSGFGASLPGSPRAAAANPALHFFPAAGWHERVLPERAHALTTPRTVTKDGQDGAPGRAREDPKRSC